ncbi:phospho-sugar mutase [Canibacter zhoujuaniae]|uniref:phospho-sugar mutase n=1 Tax=Canibacter zhoujuaniae TaxID=2708343 RepID=UPI00141F6596|nr:phospho-sugar mutase [Canibacter zhoujuaniae]
MTLAQELLARVSEWIAADPDPTTASELQALLDQALGEDRAAAHDLTQRFSGRLKFGTAGLRAELGAGPQRMNRVVVQQTTAGFVKFLQLRFMQGEIAKKRVVIGFDARKNSEIFARDAAEIFAGAGFDAHLLPGPLPTPVTAFAVRHLNAAAGVMITASHNPPNDNGYKVYLGDADAGSQIVPPVDGLIAEFIDEVAATPISDYPRNADGVQLVGAEIIYDYLRATAQSVLGAEQQGAAVHPKLVYTAMHGVGTAPTVSLFAAAGLPELELVPEQVEPDDTFPTVAFPNPEEPGALDLAITRARVVGADAIIAHDPDADRLAIALPERDANGAKTDRWKMLTGNQLGLLLGWRAARQAAAKAAEKGLAVSALEPQPALACTIVSSPALKVVADHYGLAYFETLSGFKWVSRVPGLVFGFEEALGYLVNPSIIRDKDGISAAVAAAEMLTALHAQGKTLWDELDAAYELFGAFASTQVTVRLESSEAVLALAERLRQNPPEQFGTVPVVKYQDLAEHPESTLRANVMRFDLAGGSRVMVRPSGTEPKLKLYIDVCVTEGTVAERKRAAEGLLVELETAIRKLLAV